jgi:squalene-hopene/tetraprenyl-beta-curcumene cyclase
MCPALLVGQDSSTKPESTSAQASPIQAERQRIVAAALKYLKEQGQAEDGTFSKRAGPGVTALVLTGMLRNGAGLDDVSVQKGLKAMEGFVQPDGGIYGSGRLKNYETCVGVLCFAEANKLAGDGRYNKVLADAKQFLMGMQIVDASNPENGGVGYAGAGRPDLSNTTYFLAALQALDVSGTDPAVQRALVFVSRCQNLVNEHNENPVVAKVNDGGFFYHLPTERDLESIDDSDAEGGLRSYASMTYSGLKSMIYAGLKEDDPRVKAALDWLSKHYSLTENPGMGTAGLYYYFHTFGAAFNATGKQEFKTADGTQHDWKSDLVNQLAKVQNEDGSWENENQRWFENDKNLATAFALLALSYCK